MILIDTHCHIDVQDFDADRDRILAHCQTLGIQRILVPGYVAAQWPMLRQVCGQYSWLLPAPGLHPMYTEQHQPAQLKTLELWAAEGRLTAIGEIGLDAFIPHPDHQAQLFYLQAQLALARQARLPVVLHIRKAHDQVIALLRRQRFDQGGIAHAFNGSRQQAERLIELGFKIGVCATLTYPRATRIRALLGALPLSALVLETDAPDLPGILHRGTRNSPEFLPEILVALAELRALPAHEIARHTTANALAVLGLTTAVFPADQGCGKIADDRLH